jgi:hypothetical protein
VVQLKVQEAQEAEVGNLHERGARGRHQGGPVPVPHRLAVEVVHEGEHRGHVLHLVPEPTGQLHILQPLGIVFTWFWISRTVITKASVSILPWRMALQLLKMQVEYDGS